MQHLDRRKLIVLKKKATRGAGRVESMANTSTESLVPVLRIPLTPAKLPRISCKPPTLQKSDTMTFVLPALWLCGERKPQAAKLTE